MGACDFVEVCPFFNEAMHGMEAIGEVLKHKYCMGEHQDECARLSVRNQLGATSVPRELWPNDAVGASVILASAGQ